MDYKSLLIIIFVIIIAIGLILFRSWLFKIERKQRRDYYRSYLQSYDWKRKRYIVLKRDNWRCVYCGAPATQVHHKRYAKINIGREPIEWLVSVCEDCHNALHH